MPCCGLVQKITAVIVRETHFQVLTYQYKHMSPVHMAFTDLCRDVVDGIAPLVHGQLVAYLHLPSLSFEPDNMKMSP